jgi:hypothetical protein
MWPGAEAYQPPALDHRPIPDSGQAAQVLGLDSSIELGMLPGEGAVTRPGYRAQIVARQGNGMKV